MEIVHHIGAVTESPFVLLEEVLGVEDIDIASSLGVKRCGTFGSGATATEHLLELDMVVEHLS